MAVEKIEGADSEKKEVKKREKKEKEWCFLTGFIAALNEVLEPYEEGQRQWRARSSPF